jgi:hypothetical protein
MKMKQAVPGLSGDRDLGPASNPLRDPAQIREYVETYARLLQELLPRDASPHVVARMLWALGSYVMELAPAERKAFLGLLAAEVSNPRIRRTLLMLSNRDLHRGRAAETEAFLSDERLQALPWNAEVLERARAQLRLDRAVCSYRRSRLIHRVSRTRPPRSRRARRSAKSPSGGSSDSEPPPGQARGQRLADVAGLDHRFEVAFQPQGHGRIALDGDAASLLEVVV